MAKKSGGKKAAAMSESKQIESEPLRKGGRNRVEITKGQLLAFVRSMPKPSLRECACYFTMSGDTIERRIREWFDLTYAEFRAQNMIFTRHKVFTVAVQKAEAGDNEMIKEVLKRTDELPLDVPSVVVTNHVAIEAPSIAQEELSERIKALEEANK
jgi:hypothetical protein